MVLVVELFKFEFNKPIEGINGMPKISIDSDTGTGFEVQRKLISKIKLIDTLDNQTIESINEQLYVDG